jgi:hypothetical protein
MKPTLCATVIHSGIKPEHRSLLTYIDNTDFSKYFDKAVSLGMIPATADRDAMVFGLKQYYAIAMLDPANGHAVSDVLDPLWHAHMLFSVEYTDFCKVVVGEYMHHVPLIDGDTEARAKIRLLYDSTLQKLTECFSHVDQNVWPTMVDERLVCRHQGSTIHYTGMQQHRLYAPDAALATA